MNTDTEDQPVPYLPTTPCPGGKHLAYADRTTEPWHWACRRCAAIRPQGQPWWSA